MNKLLFHLSIIILFPMSVIAQNDSISTTVNLDEIEIEAPKVVRKADVDMYFPSASAVKHSKNGLQLLRNMMIPAVFVNDVLNTVSSSGNDVQLRINGRIATSEQVQSLLPETIKRIEWIENPGLKYNGATSVLNFIVSNPLVGGSLIAKAMPALNCAWGDNYASLKLNNGRSQFGVTSFFKLTDNIGYQRDYYQTITFSDGSLLHRKETPLAGHIDNNFGNLAIDYSYIKPDTTTLWIAVRGDKTWAEKVYSEGLMISFEDDSETLVKDYSNKHGFSPSASVYLEQHFSKNQLIAIDMNATFYKGSSQRKYSEQPYENDSYPLTDINTNIHDSNQAYGIDANYIKKWDKSRLTAGVSYNANRNKLKYDNLNGKIFHQRLDRLYFYAEYFQQIKKLSVSAGLGAQYTDFLFKETEQGSRSWNLRPQVSLSYAINMKHQLKLNFNSWQSAPTLEQTSIAPQQTDAFLWTVGNPNLKTSSSYMLKLQYNFMIPRVNGSFGINAFTSPNAIAPCINWIDEKLVSSYENSKGLRNLSFIFSPQIELIPGWLDIAGSIQYRLEHMRGSNYSLNNNNLSGYAVAILRHWDFTLMASYQKCQINLLGETKKWGETISILSLSYDWKKFQFTAGALCPFGEYDQGHMSVNKYFSYETHYRVAIAPMPFIQIRYNLQWGRQKRDIHKNASNSATVEKSSTAGR